MTLNGARNTVSVLARIARLPARVAEATIPDTEDDFTELEPSTASLPDQVGTTSFTWAPLVNPFQGQGEGPTQTLERPPLPRANTLQPSHRESSKTTELEPPPKKVTTSIPEEPPARTPGAPAALPARTPTANIQLTTGLSLTSMARPLSHQQFQYQPPQKTPFIPARPLEVIGEDQSTINFSAETPSIRQPVPQPASTTIGVAQTKPNQQPKPTTTSGIPAYVGDKVREYTNATELVDKNRANLIRLFFSLNTKFISLSSNTYITLKQVGSGGFAVVNQAISLDGKFYAIKLVKLQGTNPASASLKTCTVEAVRQEVQVMESLKGRNICLDIIEHKIVQRQDGGMAIIVMELGDGDLRHLMQQCTKRYDPPPSLDNPQLLMSEHQIGTLLYDMIVAVKGMHEANFIHCDLKPQNFMFHEGRLKLIDFGISKRMEANTTMAAAETIMGTPKYMAPEVVRYAGSQAKLHRAADVWSIGIILYEMATGFTPFDKILSSPNGLITLIGMFSSKNISIDFTKLRSSPELRDLIEQCLQCDDTQRISTKGILEHPFMTGQRLSSKPASS
ncbi:Kinase, TTK [Giardia muris]|uniref:Kinase, TTK n=1 Tax=Giardia muris TaxID=5742 RepID=A0A4Z1SU45_GIAMU|nr:Kinase, TTK [Giardia muris]|eukprot:TNJ27138.1 Kinase, TTK [Giardia muris]